MRRRPLVAVTAVLFGAAIIAACSSDPGEVPRAKAFRPVPEVSPRRRLARWDGTAFRPVGSASIERGHLYVLVPGSPPGLVTELAAAITDGDPDAVVLRYQWLEAPHQADLNGQRLAVALEATIAPAFRTNGGMIHLVGQGYGAKVAVIGGIGLTRPPEQITLLDAPEKWTARVRGSPSHLDGYLPLLPLGRTEGKTFVDSYYSLAGARYGAFPALVQVVDVALRSRSHRYPARWYSDSARRASVGVGFGWSPLVGAPPSCLVCFFRQVPQLPRADGSSPDPLDLRLVPAPIALRSTSRRIDATVVRGPETGREPEGVELVAPRRGLWQVELSRASGDRALSFDTRFTAPTPGAELAVFLDDIRVFTTAADLVGSRGQHAVLDVSSLSEGTHTFTALLVRPRLGATAVVRPTRAVLGGFRVQAVKSTGGASPGLSDGARAALVGLGVVAIVALLGGLVVRRRRAGSAAG